LAEYISQKQEQVERLEDRIENLIEQEMASLVEYQASRPAVLSLRPGRRAGWESEQAKKLAFLQQLHNRLERVREIKEEMSVQGPRIKELAIRKLRMKEPDLAVAWDDIRTAHRLHEGILVKRSNARHRHDF
jgi:hypothetical protein